MSTIIPELEIFGVYSRGIPNSEKIVLRSNGPVYLGDYALLLGYDTVNETALPLTDHFLWLGNHRLMVPAWIFVYTGKGDPGTSQEQHTKDPCQNLYWNKENVIFTNPKINPTLVRLDCIEIGRKGETPVMQLDHRKQTAITDEILKTLERMSKFDEKK